MSRTTKKIATGELPLDFAKLVSEQANAEFEDGSLLEKVSPITRELLIYWNPNGNFAEVRNINFHKGQWQAILNTIYLHEVLKIKDVKDMYSSISPELLTQMDFFSLRKEKHEHPKYCVKMATGTGKTWVMHALLIWQYLNAKHEEEVSGRFSKNFLLVAPGLIVYERLLDAYLGKEREDKTRDFETSDIKKFEELFLPQNYRQELIGFIQSNTIKKENIGDRTNGMVAITNWHVLSEEIVPPEIYEPLESPELIVKKLLPKTPGTTAGHTLDVLDREHFRGKQIEFLANLPDLVMINDEAHHLGGEDGKIDKEDKQWQEAITKISRKKKDHFIQIDFSATPYIVKGSGQNRSRLFFPHIIVNFELKEAIHSGLVKIVAIDKRKGEGAEELDFKAEREGKAVKDLSGGQRVMLRAGLSKLKILEEAFEKFNEKGNKNPKLLVICEDTKVVPKVVEFLRAEGLGEEEVMEIHSNKKGEVGEKEWSDIKQKLFNVDKYRNPRVIVSVLMLREGFDVNNICVIVPLRSSTSFILLEQVIGRGLRLMWREPDYIEIKEKNRINLLKKRIEPDNYLDLLHIVEHPEYEKFYETELSSEDIARIDEKIDKERVMGDLLNIGLKEDYEEYDLFWPIIIQDKEEELKSLDLTIENLDIYPIHLSELKKYFEGASGDKFVSKEITKETKFGEYEVTAEIFSAKSYNQFLQKMVNSVSIFQVQTGKRKDSQHKFYNMQVNLAQIAKLTDEYIRHKLFNQEFDPFEGNNWRILLSTGAKIVEHIRKNISKAIYELQNSLDVKEAKIIKKYFSEVKEMRVRETCSLEVAKTIYSRAAFPSNRGGFEKAFIEFVDGDSQVEKFIKIREYDYSFANIIYVREDGLLAHYFPDFIVKIGDEIFLVETKAERDLNNYNVQQKRKSTVDWCNKVNELPEEERMDCKWSYALLGERTFYSMSSKEASTKEILNYAKMTKSKINGTLTGFFGEDDKY